jgi:two-component system chemotaxis response regulator CheY
MAGGEKKQILVVDDSRTMRQLLRMVLGRSFACEVCEAEDGNDAVGKIQSGDFDLVITDINMPNMNGLALVSTVREELNLNTPIIIVSTMGQEEDRDKGISLGADSYVTKPVDGTKLVSAVSGLLQ